ncbi:MAG: zf-HC2 domain-containing protein [candidate division NC10 bacterium]|nr:zf-HC2 domain-containing protein [candidate division NC10 bacterium]
MECEEAKFGLYALLDDELDVAKNLEILSHLEGCPACQRELELDERLKVLVREQLSACSPSSQLWAKVARQIEQETEEGRHPWEAFSKLWPKARLFQAALAGLAVVVVFSVSLLLIHSREAPSLLVDELVKDHIRSVTKESGPVDVLSADLAEIVQHFRAKFPFPSSVPVLVHEGSRLVGGSFCQLGETKGIRFTYELGNGRTVSLYQLERSERTPFPRPGSGHLYVGQPQGPGLVLWGDEGFLYALVAELPPEDLQRLASHMGGI